MNGGYGVYLPQLTKTNKYLIIIFGALFLLGSVLQASSGVSLVGLLGLSWAGVKSGMVFQIVSYPFVGRGLIEVLFNGLILWFIGCELEKIWGTKRYLQFMAFTAIGGAIIFIGISALLFAGSAAVSMSGMAGIASALLISYAILYPDRVFTFMLIFPMKAKYFCLLLVGIQLYLGFFSPAAAMAWGQLGSMASGVLFMVMVSRKRIKAPKIKRRAKHLSIVQDDDKEPKYWH